MICRLILSVMLCSIQSLGSGRRVVASYPALRNCRGYCRGPHADSSSSLRQHRALFVKKLSRRSLPQPAVAAATTTWGTPAGFNDQPSIAEDSDVHAPLPLPPTPKSSNFVDVFPYLAKLALSEKTLYWRLATALGLMVLSKVAGDSFISPHLSMLRLPEHLIKQLALIAV